MPRVSVITPTFNCASFIERALQSVVDQTYSDLEIIVVDDGSTDETAALLERWKGKVTYLSQSNAGPSAARNLGISRSNGEFIAYLDADDMWCPGKLEQQVAFLDLHPECGLVHSDLYIIDEQDNPIQPNWYQLRQNAAVSGHCLKALLKGCAIQVPTVLERRSCHDRSGGFDTRFHQSEDYLHWIRAALNGYAVGYIPEPLAMYRWRSGSLSKNHVEMTESMIRMFELLVEEHTLLQGSGAEADLVRGRLDQLRRSLPHHYRQQGHHTLARRKAASLIRTFPYHSELYLELFKSCVPSFMARVLNRLRSGLNF
ncbi:glycosyltransferase family 2 protein [Pelotalea chapellei]|uniref:Glycosyltransferase n=1 Tax=Pelotalea chapellei TaxID=44671 RepID=A0ABS5U5A7_9BACT|nr:glycosyltransferase family 2 protein [Pelotalea chapellei]MBT1070840.1 glycosyltransferase [Pelotalea chapellei]